MLLKRKGLQVSSVVLSHLDFMTGGTEKLAKLNTSLFLIFKSSLLISEKVTDC